MIRFFIGFLTFFNAFFSSRYSLGLEILALRQQLGVLKRKRPHARLRIQDRIFWILLRRLWPAWSNVLLMVKPETVLGWHRAGFRLFWRFRSRTENPGRPTIDAEIRTVARLVQYEEIGICVLALKPGVVLFRAAVLDCSALWKSLASS